MTSDQLPRRQDKKRRQIPGVSGKGDVEASIWLLHYTTSLLQLFVRMRLRCRQVLRPAVNQSIHLALAVLLAEAWVAFPNRSRKLDPTGPFFWFQVELVRWWNLVTHHGLLYSCGDLWLCRDLQGESQLRSALQLLVSVYLVRLFSVNSRFLWTLASHISGICLIIFLIQF